MKKVVVLILIVVLLLSFASFAFAHGGRTDSSGGHKDNNNVSGLGSYHYHHGYEAHLHEDGVCPYSTDLSSDSTASDTETSSSSNSQPENNKKPSYAEWMENQSSQTNETKEEEIQQEHGFDSSIKNEQFEDEKSFEEEYNVKVYDMADDSWYFNQSVKTNAIFFIVAVITLLITAFFCHMYCIKKAKKTDDFLSFYILTSIISFLACLLLTWVSENAVVTSCTAAVVAAVSSCAWISAQITGSDTYHVVVLRRIWLVLLTVALAAHSVLLIIEFII